MLQVELDTFFMELHVALKNTDKVIVIRIGVLVDIFTSHSSHFKEKSTVFVAKDKL